MLIFVRKNTEAFDKETRTDNIDISDVDANADLFGKYRKMIRTKMTCILLI